MKKREMEKRKMQGDITRLQLAVERLSERVFELECPQGWRIEKRRIRINTPLALYDRGMHLVYVSVDKTVIIRAYDSDAIYSYSKQGDIISVMKTLGEEVKIKHYCIASGEAVEIEYTGDVDWVDIPSEI